MPPQERHHRRSTQISPAEINRVHHHISRAFSGEIPAHQNRTSSLDLENEEALYSSSSSSNSSNSSQDPNTSQNKKQTNRRSFFPSNIGTPRKSYSRAMHAYHATSQPTSPPLHSNSPPKPSNEQVKNPETGTPSITVPHYAKTMHAFTLNQLNHLNNTGSHNRATTTKTNNTTSTTANNIPTGPTPTTSPILPLTSPLALKLPPLAIPNPIPLPLPLSPEPNIARRRAVRAFEHA